MEVQGKVTKTKGQFEMISYLQREKEETLNLYLICKQSLSFYSLLINQNYLKNHSDMSSLFPNPSSLLFTLIQLFEQLELSQEGIITLKLSLAAASINLTKVYQLRMETWNDGELLYLRKRIMEQQEEAQAKIQQKQYEAAAIVAQKQLQIAILKKNLQEKDAIIADLKQKLKKHQVDIDCQKQRITDMEESLSQANTKLNLSENVNSKLEIHIQQATQQLQEKEKTIDHLKEQENKALSYQQKVLCSVLEYSPQLYHFHYTYTPNGLKVTKKTENGWSNFVSASPVPFGQTSTFLLRLNKLRDGSLAIGVGSQAVFAYSCLEHAQFVGYLCRDGRIYQNGMRKINGTAILTNQAVTLTISRKAQGSISWYAQGVQVGVASLPTSLNNKRLFLIVKVFWKEDEFELYF